MARRSVDWSVLLGQPVPQPVVLPSTESGELAELLSACDALRTEDQLDAVCRRAIEVARSHLGLVRVGLFLMDRRERRMLGTWGTGLDGELTDERHVMFEVKDGVLDVFRRAEAGHHFTVLDNCPIVSHAHHGVEVVGRGWLACTPIRTARGRLGMMFNDAGVSSEPVDEAKQSRAAILCSLLAGHIEGARWEPEAPEPTESPERHPLLEKALQMLGENPTLAGKEMAAELGVSPTRLVRLFKSELGMSLVDYRNRLRIGRFRSLVDGGEHNLLKLARAAGFGSYAQFHRVFRKTHGAAPSDYVRER